MEERLIDKNFRSTSTTFLPEMNFFPSFFLLNKVYKKIFNFKKKTWYTILTYTVSFLIILRHFWTLSKIKLFETNSNYLLKCSNNIRNYFFYTIFEHD